MLKLRKLDAASENESLIPHTERRLLIVDDERAILHLLKNLFEPYYTVQTADSGQEALQILQGNFSPQVIIADQRMSAMSGAQFLAESRAIVPDAVRVTLTGYADVKEIVESVNNGAIYRFIGKPWEDAELLETIRLCFDQYDLSTRNAALQEALGRIEVLNAEKNDIMGIVSHDLKNPISAILGMTELMSSASGFTLEKEDYEKFSALIHQTAVNMLDLVKGLLDDYWLESGKMQLSTVTLDVKMIVQFIVNDYQQRATDKNITLLLDAPKEMFALADERRLQQVLDNLISNAVKYSPTGKQVVVRLTDYARRESNVSNTTTPILQASHTIRIAVHDQGPGLTDEDKTKLFGKFARLSAQPTDGEHSSGLGLSIVKRMVEAMNGKVWCESEAGKGASFIVELPQAHHTES